MAVQPGVDTREWEAILAHRPADQRRTVRDRFLDSGVPVGLVQEVLADGGDAPTPRQRPAGQTGPRRSVVRWPPPCWPPRSAPWPRT